MGIKQTYNHSPWVKHFMLFKDFSGGVNTRDISENMRDSEFKILDNCDIPERGAVKKRNGINYQYFVEPDFTAGKTVGHHRFRHRNICYDFWFNGGRIYKVDLSNEPLGVWENPKELSLIPMPIYSKKETETSNKYQYNDGRDLREVACVQKDDKLYIYNGFRPLVYDFEVDKIYYLPVTQVTPIQATKMGYNLLSDDPLNDLKQGVTPTLIAEGVSASRNVGLVNQEVEISGWISCPTDKMKDVRVRWYAMTDKDGEEKMIHDWKPFTENSKIKYKLTYDGSVDIRMAVCYDGEQLDKDGKETEQQKGYWKSATLPGYKFSTTDEHKPLNRNALWSCNQAMVHHNKVLLWGSSEEGYQNHVFISATNDFCYYPHYHYLEFETPSQEAVQTISQLYDRLIVFTKNNIFSVSGYSALNPLYFEIENEAQYKVRHVNSVYGTVAPKSVTPVSNELYFLAHEGICKLKGTTYNSDDRFNVDVIDTKIANEVPKVSDGLDVSKAIGVRLDRVYSLIFPDQGYRWNFYLDYGVWSRHTKADNPVPTYWVADESPLPTPLTEYSAFEHSLSLQDVFIEDNLMFGVSRDGFAVEHFHCSYALDGGRPYEMHLLTKDYSMAMPMHQKKFKEAFFMVSSSGKTTARLPISIYTDKGMITRGDVTVYNVDPETNTIISTVEPSKEAVTIPGVTMLGNWEMGVSRFPTIDSAFIYRYPCNGKAHIIRMELRDSSLNILGLHGMAFTYKLKKPKV